MTARRMLFGIGAGPLAVTLPPFDTSWVRVATVLEPAETWEQTSIQEADVHWDGSQFRMWAKGGWDDSALGHYTSPDGVTWTAYGSNPVLGGGGSGFAPELSQPCIFIDGATYYCYFNSGGDSDPNTPRYATSTDGLAWTVGGATFITNPGTITQWGNRTVWKEGSSWFMLQEARASGVWKIFYATSSNGTSWTLGNSSNPLTTLQPGAAGSYGGPTLLTIAGTYHLWYHAKGSAGDSPTDLYHATSTDKITWTISPSGPILTHTGSGDEADQIADPSVLVVGAKAYLFYAGVVNGSEAGVILLARYP